MNSKKKITFLTGTRADFGKLKSLIKVVENDDSFESNVFATGMHLNAYYGYTIDEIYKNKIKNVFPFINHENNEFMDRTLSKTIEGFSHFVHENSPDLIVVHGDRVEALAGAIVGSLNNILVAHVEGGELSGTIDELIRHSITKLSHIHLVANEKARKRLIQLGEIERDIHIIGSPDIDIMSSRLPEIEDVKNYYEIAFSDYAIAMFHPVTTEYDLITTQIKIFVDSLIESDENYVLVYPNNDKGSKEILKEYARLTENRKFKIFPSLRFEFFLTLLKYSKFIIGNSSAGIKEASFFITPTINIGTRQLNRDSSISVRNVDLIKTEILDAIKNISKIDFERNNANYLYGRGDSDKRFLKLIHKKSFWSTNIQKQFQEL